jgi:hypothetical protein
MVCACAWREICRQVFDAMYRTEELKEPAVFTRIRGGLAIARPFAEFRADVTNAAKRVLDTAELSIFRDYRREWSENALGLDRGAYFHLKYRMEEKLGRELVRVGLYPASSYIAAGLLATEQVGKPTQCRKAA